MSAVRKILVFIFIFAIVFAVVDLVFGRFFIDSLSDIHVLWAGACLAQGQKFLHCQLAPIEIPYAASVLRSYPPWSLPFYYWMSWFELHTLAIYWRIITEALFALIAALLFLLHLDRNLQSTLSKPILFSFVFWSVVSVVFWFPTYDHIHVGQLNVIQLVALILAIIFSGRQRFILAGICLAVSAIKPQSVYLIYWVLALLSFKDVRYRKMCFSMLAAIVVLTVIGYALRSHLETGLWPIKVTEVTAWLQPNFGSHLQKYFGNTVWLRWIPTIISLVIMTLVFRRFRPLFSVNSLLVLIPMSLVTSPYTNIHDGIFLSIVLSLVGVWSAKNSSIKKQIMYFLTLLVLFLLCLNPDNITGIAMFLWVFLAVALFSAYFLICSKARQS